MKQKTVYRNDKVCGNKKFRYCDVGELTHKCVNCEYSFCEDVKEGDKMISTCSSCDREIEITVSYTTLSWNESNHSHEGGECQAVGACAECNEDSALIEELFERYRWGNWGYKDIENRKDYDGELYIKQRDADLEKIANLPKRALVHFLRSAEGGLER